MINNFNATTPQLKVVDRAFQAYRTCDLTNAAPILSKNFVYKPFPKVPDLGDQTKEEHLASLGPKITKLVKLEFVFHEVIEAPGKVVVQWTSLCTPPNGPMFEYDSISIIHLVEEDGELKILEFHHFADQEKRSHFFYKTLAGGGQTA